MINLNDFKLNIYSAGGEDGIIKWLLKYIKNPTNFVVECGAHDGVFFSNTARLWKDLKTYDALLIESDREKYDLLVENTKNYQRVKTVHAELRNIDDYTDRVADVFSLDVDGNEYHILHRMRVPHQIIIVEHNPTVPPHVDMISIEGQPQGSSALSITKLMKDKDYTLVAVTKTNCIFMYGDWHYEFETDLNKLFDYSSLNYVCTSYNGGYDMIGEFGYGFSHPINLRLQADGLKQPTIDAYTKEWIRQIQAIEGAKNDN